jgi:HD-GYP domain-containing protein (c-di-GMP phosphodiesterase class II)
MGTARGERLAPLLALGAAAATVPVASELAFGHTQVTIAPVVHFYAVGMTALGTAVAALVLTWIGAHLGDARTVLIGTAFAVMAALLALHGISTPGFLFPQYGYGEVMITGGATLPAGALILALSSLRLPFVRRVGPLLVLQGALIVAILALGALGLVYPSLLPTVPAANSPEALSVLGAGLALFALLVWRALRTYLLSRRTADLIVALGLLWLGVSLVAALTLTYSDLGWWLGHMFELDGILIVAVPVALDLAHTAQARPLAGDLSAADLVTSEEVFLGSQVRALMLRLAEKDSYTEQHTRRVALRAVQVGTLLGLSRSRLRSLAIGALVHDIGKLSVPDAILKKPGPLDDREFRVIQRHPDWGAKLLDELGGFSGAVRHLVRDHHERLDGRGYPDGIAGDAIALDTRILSVCDVYDALISSRVYRGAWSHEQAMALLGSEAGHAFDERCVDALRRVLEAEVPAEETRPARTPLASPVAATA